LRPYEVMLILPAEADEKVVTTAVDRITKAIEPSGGSVLGIDRWGRRRFAFEVDRQTEGYYAVVAFDAEPETVAPLERALTLADEVMRAKVTIRHPQKAERAEPKARRSAPAATPEPDASASEPAADAQAASPDTDETTTEDTAETEPSPAPA
jgi:small subunit ribosomal protein S6